MKIVLGVLAVVVLLNGAQSCFAQLGLHRAPYQSGFKHGIDDAKNNGCETCPTYIFQPGKIFYFHTKEFIQGYMQKI